MDGNHPKNTDPRPKRAKDKDNPYTIFTVGIHSGHPHYYVQFSDASGVERCVEVKKEVFALMDGCELEDKSHLNEVDRHYEHSELTRNRCTKEKRYIPNRLRTLYSVQFKERSCIGRLANCRRYSAAGWCFTISVG